MLILPIDQIDLPQRRPQCYQILALPTHTASRSRKGRQSLPLGGLDKSLDPVSRSILDLAAIVVPEDQTVLASEGDVPDEREVGEVFLNGGEGLLVSLLDEGAVVDGHFVGGVDVAEVGDVGGAQG